LAADAGAAGEAVVAGSPLVVAAGAAVFTGSSEGGGVLMIYGPMEKVCKYHVKFYLFRYRSQI
jgi:hypothetical protein